MPAKPKTPARKPAASSRGTKRPAPKAAASVSTPGVIGRFVRGVLTWSFLLVLGVIGGYLWRSYYPLILPFETPLVADKQSLDVPETLRDELAVMEARAEKAEKKCDQLEKQLADLEEDQEKSEEQLGDLQIKEMLQSN